jgi:flagellar basal-body rod protein FlgC
MAGIFTSIEVSGSGMSLQRRKMNVVSQNIANAETTKTEEGGPYRRRRLEVSAEDEKLPFQTVLKNSQSGLLMTNKGHLPEMPVATSNYETVAVARGDEVQADENAYRLVYDPTHPDANADGYVKMPDVELINEMVDMMSANRAYEANALSIASSKEMLKNALDI